MNLSIGKSLDHDYLLFHRDMSCPSNRHNKIFHQIGMHNRMN